jgi:D-3-phosphoglycerate dehydrogenase / 2-oxoglutarate reductase
MSTVLVTDYTWESTAREAAVLAEVGASLVAAETGAEDELLDLVPEADAILTCFAHVTPAVIRAGERLKVIGRYGIGVDNIAVDEATRRGIPVTNVPAYCLHEVAEHVLALILCMARGIHLYDRAVRRGHWALATGRPIPRIAGSTLGIVGFGRIGRALAAKAAGLGLHVVAHSPSTPQDHIRVAGAEPVELLELARRSDFVSLHVPLTERTRNLVGDAFLAAMKPTAYLVNAARGAVVDRVALQNALANQQIAGAALDVFVPEQLEPDDPLLAGERLLATPHVAFYSEESVAALATLAASNVAAVLAGKRPADIVNPEIYELTTK